MTKNKAQRANNRAKNAKLRTKDRQLEKAREATKFKAKQANSLDHFATRQDIGYEFWLLHGVNYLLSSYEEGVWSPLFPEAYLGKPVTRAELFKRVLAQHLNKVTNQLSPEGMRSVLWSSLKPAEMFSLVNRAKKYAREHDGDPLAQSQPEVWHFLHTVMEEFSKGLDAKGKTVNGKLSLPVEQYGVLLPEAVAETVSNLSGVQGPARR